MKIILVSSDPANQSAYLQEILKTYGYTFCERMDLPRALAVAEPGRDLLILPAASPAEGVVPFLEAGGRVLASLSDQSLEAAAGVEATGEYHDFSRLRFVRAICRGTRGEPLWTAGTCRCYSPRPDSKDFVTLAYGYRIGDNAAAVPAIMRSRIGAGELVIYGYDVAHCIKRLRQGYPERANFLPEGMLTPRAMFLQSENQPHDTHWRPTADLHALAFSEIVRNLLESAGPVPCLWHLPDAQRSLLIFTADEDASTLEEDEVQFADVESHGGISTLYIFPGNTEMTSEKIREFTQRGHTISVHPYLSDAASQSPAEQLQEAKNQVRLFQERFNWPVHTVRNHSIMWPGYLELAEIWEQLSIGMDANFYSLNRGESPDWGPFLKLHAAMPLRFVREDGTLIDVFQQPSHTSDDVLANQDNPLCLKYSPEEATAVFERMLDDAMCFGHYPICVNFHPCNYVQYSAPHGRAVLELACERALPIWSIDRWHDFWRARDTWKITDRQWDGACLRLRLAGLPCLGLTLALTAACGTATLTGLKINDADAPWNFYDRHGRRMAMVALPPDCAVVMVSALYSPNDRTDAPH